MDPQEWQRLAEEVASEVTTALDEIEAEFWTDSADPSFRTFWPRIRALSDRLRTAPAIDIENKLALLGRIRQLTKRAREDQEVFFEEQKHRKQELLDRIEELRSRAMSSNNPADIREIRQELQGMRESVSGISLPTRGDRQQTWETWQTANQQVWDHLNELWTSNETYLTELLDNARTRLDRGQIKETRDLIRDFNSGVKDREVSHKSNRALRARANQLWKDTEDVARVKHEAFMKEAPERVERWKQVQGRNASAIARLRAEIGKLEQNAEQSSVAAAFSRAMIEDKLRELERLESTNDSLGDRIENTEAALVG